MFKTKKETLPAGLKAHTEDVFLIAWTTTPWTLPSNTALTVGPKIEYVTVKTYNQYTFEPITIVVAKELARKQFDKKFKEVESEEELKAYQEGDNLPAGKAGKIPFLIGPSFARNIASFPPAIIPTTISGSVPKVGGHSEASKTPSRPLVPAPM